MLLLRIITVHIKTVHMLAVPVTRRLYDVIINFIFALQEILIYIFLYIINRIYIYIYIYILGVVKRNPLFLHEIE